MKFTSFAIMMLVSQASETQKDSHRVQLTRSKYSRSDKLALKDELPKQKIRDAEGAAGKHIGKRSNKVGSNDKELPFWEQATILPIR